MKAVNIQVWLNSELPEFAWSDSRSGAFDSVNVNGGVLAIVNERG